MKVKAWHTFLHRLYLNLCVIKSNMGRAEKHPLILWVELLSNLPFNSVVPCYSKTRLQDHFCVGSHRSFPLCRSVTHSRHLSCPHILAIVNIEEEIGVGTV